MYGTSEASVVGDSVRYVDRPGGDRDSRWFPGVWEIHFLRIQTHTHTHTQERGGTMEDRRAVVMRCGAVLVMGEARTPHNLLLLPCVYALPVCLIWPYMHALYVWLVSVFGREGLKTEQSLIEDGTIFDSTIDEVWLKV